MSPWIWITVIVAVWLAVGLFGLAIGLLVEVFDIVTEVDP